MLKRRRKIHKYIQAITAKRKTLAEHPLLKKINMQIKQNNGKRISKDNNFITQAEQIGAKQLDVQKMQPYNQMQLPKRQESIDSSTNEKCWHDSDDEELEINKRNLFTKLNLKNHYQGHYQQKLRRYYKDKQKNKNWLKKGDGQYQQDLGDIINTEQIYQQHKKSIINIQFYHRTTQKHQSIVSGNGWYGDSIMYSSGYDKKLKVFTINSQESNPQLRIKLQKDLYFEGLPLSGCNVKAKKVICGTLRKNWVSIDCIKWSPTFHTSNFLSEHKTYENLKVDKNSERIAIFSKQKICLLSENNYVGSLIANQLLMDICFGTNEHQIYGISSQCLYQWDLRTMRPLHRIRRSLGYTKLIVTQDMLVCGSKLGKIYIDILSNKQNSRFQQYAQCDNLVTHISGLANKGRMVLALSKWKHNAARVIDAHQGKVIANWPDTKTKIGYAMCGAYSNQKYISIGSSNGYTTLFTIN